MVTWTVDRKEGFVITAPPGSLGITIKRYDNEYIVTDVSSTSTISEVVPRFGAEQKKIRIGDTIISIDGVPIKSVDDVLTESKKSRVIRTGERVISNNAAEHSKAELLYMKDIDCALFDIMDYSFVAEKYGEEFLNDLNPPQRKTGNQILVDSMAAVAQKNRDDDDSEKIEMLRKYFPGTETMALKMRALYPSLDMDDIFFVVPLLVEGLPSKYDEDAACTKILGKLQERRKEKKEWQNSNESTFDTEFDKPFGQCLVEVTQTKFGCWLCGNTTKTMSTCSRCKLATYCSKECQKKNWTKVPGVELGRTHKAECSAFLQCTTDEKGGPIPPSLRCIGLASNDESDMNMEKRTNDLLDELIRCNDATREILRLNVAVTWTFGTLPIFQGTLTFRDDTLTMRQVDFALFRTLGGEGDLSMKGMIDEGCGDIPDDDKERVIVYLHHFFRHARDREIKIREMTCSRATLWLCSDKYKKMLIDGEDERLGLFDVGHGPQEIVPSPTYTSYLPAVLEKYSR